MRPAPATRSRTLTASARDVDADPVAGDDRDSHASRRTIAWARAAGAMRHETPALESPHDFRRSRPGGHSSKPPSRPGAADARAASASASRAETERYLDRVQFRPERYMRHPILLWDDWEVMLIAWESGPGHADPRSPRRAGRHGGPLRHGRRGAIHDAERAPRALRQPRAPGGRPLRHRPDRAPPPAPRARARSRSTSTGRRCARWASGTRAGMISDHALRVRRGRGSSGAGRGGAAAHHRPRAAGSLQSGPAPAPGRLATPTASSAHGRRPPQTRRPDRGHHASQSRPHASRTRSTTRSRRGRAIRSRDAERCPGRPTRTRPARGSRDVASRYGGPSRSSIASWPSPGSTDDRAEAAPTARRRGRSACPARENRRTSRGAPASAGGRPGRRARRSTATRPRAPRAPPPDGAPRGRAPTSREHSRAPPRPRSTSARYPKRKPLGCRPVRPRRRPPGPRPRAQRRSRRAPRAAAASARPKRDRDRDAR